MAVTQNWIADRTKLFSSSGIRRMFDLAAKLEDPINLSIGQPDFDVPQSIKDEMIDAVQTGKNGYALTQGMPVLRENCRLKSTNSSDTKIEKFSFAQEPVAVCCCRRWRW